MEKARKDAGDGGAIAAALLLIAIVTVGLSWSGIRETACETMKDLPDSKGPCIEFWLNRYQSLAAGLLSLFAGILAVIFIQRQIQQTQEIADRPYTEAWSRFTQQLAETESSMNTLLIDAWFDPHDENIADISFDFRSKAIRAAQLSKTHGPQKWISEILLTRDEMRPTDRLWADRVMDLLKAIDANCSQMRPPAMTSYETQAELISALLGDCSRFTQLCRVIYKIRK